MASAFAHTFAAFTLGKVATAHRPPLRFWLLGILCAILPDADVLTFRLGIPYDHLLGHRGFTHSFFFALLLAVVVTAIFFPNSPRFKRKWWVLVGYFFFATSSHALLDAFTNGGLGVAFFSPFSNERYFFPWRPIQVSPIGVGNFFSEKGLRVIFSEALWVGVPGVLLLVGVSLFRNKRKKKGALRKV